MALTPEGRRKRMGFVGSSDAPVIVGVDTRRSPVDIYWEKVVELPEKKNAAFAFGNVVEQALCEWAADRMGVTIQRNVFISIPETPIGVNLDALIVGRPEAMEAKLSTEPQLWGEEEGGDAVPERTVVQTQYQCKAGEALYPGGFERVWVPSFIAGYNMRPQLRLYCVERHRVVIEMTTTTVMDFWDKHVVPRVPPGDDATPPIEVLKAIRREHGEPVELAADIGKLWDEYARLGKATGSLVDEREGVQRAIIEALGSRDAGLLPDGRMITYNEQKSSPSVDYARFRGAYPEAFAELVKQGTHRQLRIKNPTTGNPKGE